MALERVWKGLLVVAAISVVALLLVQLGVVAAPWSDDRTEVRILDDDGEPKATVDADVADTYSERYTGLSDHDSLEADEGMLFVHGDEDERTYVMRNMDFGIDIVFVGADREITTIHSAPEPGPGEDGNDHRYTGDAQWVLEVPIGYADERGIEVGDEVEIGLETD
jgi:uncharacterized protein